MFGKMHEQKLMVRMRCAPSSWLISKEAFGRTDQKGNGGKTTWQ